MNSLGKGGFPVSGVFGLLTLLIAASLIHANPPIFNQANPDALTYIDGEILVQFKTTASNAQLADAFKRNALGRWILGPAGCQLGTASTDLPKQLESLDFYAGVIAGNQSLNPWFSRILPGADDGKVSVESTKIEGMKEFLIVPNSHTWMMWRLKTVRQILVFLKYGCFE